MFVENFKENMNKVKVLQLLSRVWNGPQNVLTGKQAEEKMISILRSRFPKAQVIEVCDVSGKDQIHIIVSMIWFFVYFAWWKFPFDLYSRWLWRNVWSACWVFRIQRIEHSETTSDY